MTSPTWMTGWTSVIKSFPAARLCPLHAWQLYSQDGQDAINMWNSRFYIMNRKCSNHYQQIISEGTVFLCLSNVEHKWALRITVLCKFLSLLIRMSHHSISKWLLELLNTLTHFNHKIKGILLVFYVKDQHQIMHQFEGTTQGRTTNCLQKWHN